MSGTHSSTMAEERLFASGLTHKSSRHRVASRSLSPTGPHRLTDEVFGHGPGHVEPLGAFEVSQSKRILQIALAVVHCLLAAGVVFGYAAIKPVLVDEGVYRNHCTEDEEREGVRVCYRQELRLNFMFTVAAVATNLCALLVGTILDTYGPRVTGMIGSVVFALGCAGMAYGRSIVVAVVVVDPYLISYLLLAIGGPFIFIPSFHLANAFPRRSGLILSMLTGAFDSSSAVFLLYRVLYEKLGGITLKQWFLGYLGVPIFILTAQLFVMPSKSYKTATELVQQAAVVHDIAARESALPEDGESRARRAHRESVFSEIDSLLGGPEQDMKRVEGVDRKRKAAGVWGVMHGKPVSAQFGSFWFWGIAGFTVIQMTRVNYFVATIQPQYEFLLHSYPASVSINTFFDIALPLGGLAAIPFIGLILDSSSTLAVIATLVSLATLIGALGLVADSRAAAYTNVVLFVLYRPFYYTVVSDYCAKVFGVATFGRVYGAVICLAGAFNLSQAGLDVITHRLCGGDPRPVNAALLAGAAVVGVALAAWVDRRGRRARRALLGEEARNARNGETGRLLDEPAGLPGYGTG